MKKLYISDLKRGDSVFGELFAVKGYNKRTSAKNNNPYIDLVLSDKTGEIRGKIWSDVMSDCEEVQEKDIVSISASVEEFNGPQLKITNMTRVKDYDLGDFQPSSKKDRNKMMKELKEYADKVKNPSLGKLLNTFFEDKDTVENYKDAAAGKAVHHAYIGGLIEHTLEMLSTAESMYKLYPRLNKDTLITGIILHDIGKTKEYEVSTTILVTTKGRLKGHIFMGAEMIKKYGKKAKVDEELLDEIIHLILSHHGKMEYGSPVLPKTPEAIVLSLLDKMSARLNTAFSALDAGENNLFTPYHRILGTELYQSPFTDELKNEDIPF